MGSILTEIVPALVALISGLVGGYLTGNRQAATEYKKWKRSRADDHAKEARLAVAELSRSLGAATHAMGWLTWNARHRAKYLGNDDIYGYDKEMHQLIPAITGALAVVSALSGTLFREMDPLVREVYNIDEKIAHAGTQFLDQPLEGVLLLGAHLDDVVLLGKAFNSRIADIIQGHHVGFIEGDFAQPERFMGRPTR